MLVVTALARQVLRAWRCNGCALVHALAGGGEPGGE